MQNEVRKDGESIKFTHRFIEGFAESSYGIEVAKLAGIPPAVIERARHMLSEQRAISPGTTVKKETERAQSHSNQLVEQVEVSQAERDLINRIKKININRTTPLNALFILNELRESIETRQQGELFGAGEIQ
jgi:DNA mismatch repair protein MutS